MAEITNFRGFCVENGLEFQEEKRHAIKTKHLNEFDGIDALMAYYNKEHLPGKSAIADLLII